MNQFTFKLYGGPGDGGTYTMPRAPQDREVLIVEFFRRKYVYQFAWERVVNGVVVPCSARYEGPMPKKVKSNREGHDAT